jgi:methionine-rich copper-binding protein CopC
MRDVQPRRRLTVAWAAVAALLLSPAAALGHAGLVSSSPADGSTLDAPPTEVVLIFDAELDPDQSTFSVTGPGGVEVGAGQVDLTVADRNVMRGPVHASELGAYLIAWTARAADGDETTGSLSFSVAGSGSVSDSAVPVPNRHNALTETGIVMLALGLVWLAWIGREREVPQ